MRPRMRMKRRLRRSGNLQAMIWLVGLVVLAVTDRWWPGILILVAISILLESAMKRRTDADESDDQVETVDEKPGPDMEFKKPEAVYAPPPKMETAPEVNKAEWLPLTCPRCGAPTRAADVKWTGDAIATCPYCGSNLPLKKK